MFNNNDTLALALQIAAKAHENQRDKAGKPYILHCLEVMYKVGTHDEELAAIAVMHDVIEDHPGYSGIIAEKFSDRVIHALDCLTHEKDIDYDQYISDMLWSKDAVIVKMADLEHNSQITRMKGLTEKDFDRLKKYNKAYAHLIIARDSFN